MSLKKLFILISLSLLLPLFAYGISDAKVTGPCSNCHTMHNSQNGTILARTGTGTGWDGSGKLTGGSVQGPINQLLVTSCVGCHSSTTNQTIINIGGSRIPIVFNTVEPAYMTPGPTNALAGGNYYWVKNVDDNRGHNVYGISAADSRLTQAPGGSTFCSNCHRTLVVNNIINPWNGPRPVQDSCQACHLIPSHHKDNGVYRFLTSMYYTPTINNNQYVAGIEDPDWEQTTNNTKHNYYKGNNVISFYVNGGYDVTDHTITEFCSGCHDGFHGGYGTEYGAGMGRTSPWIRHPTDISLPATGEYGGYDPVNSYSTEAPVAWLDPANPSRAGAVVMCLSCHRAHGSPYPSMLRWDYNNMVAGDVSKSGGCFTCHTQKN